MRCCLALLCALAAMTLSLVHVGTALAHDASPGAEQVSSNEATSSATNDSETSQSSSQVQEGGGASTGQSQTVVQSASTEQSGGSTATSTQAATNAGSGGKKTQQGNTSSATSSAGNANATNQSSTQAQSAAPAPDPAGAGASGHAQAVHQSAPTKQTADAEAASTQQAPTNVNIVVRVDSPGNDGPVTQTNSSVADATAGNANRVTQAGTQAQAGGGTAGGQSQVAEQSAPTTQASGANAASTQVNPLNLNIVVRNKSPGDTAGVTQANVSQATAGAANTNAVTQGSEQAQTGGGATGGQSQVAIQDAPTSQTASSTATSAQVAPTNASVSIALVPAADPAGSGVPGTLIQIWIPASIGSSATNTSNAASTATNSSTVTQTAQQTQTGGSAQAGGSGQFQEVVQNASTKQGAAATASSTQSGGGESGSATATATSSDNVSQVAEQSADGALSEATPLYVVGSRRRPFAGAGWVLAGGSSVFTHHARAWTPRKPVTREPHSRPAGRKDFAPHQPHPPVPPQAPAALGAATGGSPGGSLLVFSSLLLPFFLRAPSGARRRRPSVVRRLMGVVSRLERPG